MRAAYYTGNGGSEVIKVGDLPEPNPGPFDVKVKVEYAALNHLDIWVRRGIPGLKINFPHIFCGDASGVICAIGSQVTRAKVNDAVIVHPGVSCMRCDACVSGWESLCRQYQILGEHRSGTAAQFVVVPETNVFARPANVNAEGAACIPLVFTTAYQMLVRRAEVKANDYVLVHAAASGVSSAAIQIAKWLGAKVMATAGSDEKLALAKRLGADEVVHYGQSDFLDAAKRWTQKRGVDIIIDHVGESLWEKNILAMRWGGKLVTCGATTGYAATTDLRQLFYRQLTLMGSTMGSKRDFPQILAGFESGHLKPVLDCVQGLGEAAKAQERMEGRQSMGKVVLDVTNG